LQHAKGYPTYHDMGAEVDKMGGVLQAALAAHSLTFTRSADEYPADPTSDLYPTWKDVIASAGNVSALEDIWAAKVAKYFISIEQGIRNAQSDVMAEVKRCPGTQIVLAGYSQGAIVMHQVELRLAKDTAVTSRIAGTLLLGDGDRTPNSKATLFGNGVPDESAKALKAGEGIRPYFKLVRRQDVALPATTAEICNAKDIVCDFKLGHDNTPLRIKKAGSVHTSYAIKNKNGSIRSYSPLLSSAANWLAAKIVAAHAPPPPPPPPPPLPARSVPAIGPTLVYTGGTAGNADVGDTSFNDFAQATGESADVEDTLPDNFDGYRCVVLDLNESFDSAQTSLLAGYLGAGGTILALGEHEGAGWDEADSALNTLASAVGAAGLSLNDDSYDDGDNATTAIEPSPLTAGVADLGDNRVSRLDVQAPAQTLVETAEDNTVPFIAVQAVGPGTFVMAGDSNLFSDNNDGFYDSDSNGVFVRNLCP
jgi:hypothetical protein